MATGTFSTASLLSNCDEAFPNVGRFGYLTLLSGILTVNLAFTADAATNRLTTATAHKLVTGSRLQLFGDVLPTPLLANTDYYAIAISTTVLSVATSLANAQAAMAIDLTDAGSGTLTLAEQALVATDPLTVLVNKEISHPSWTARKPIDDLGAATDVFGAAQKPVKTITVSNTAATALEYQHYLVIESTVAGALSSIPVGAGHIFSSEATVQSIDPGSNRPLLLTLRARNA